MRQAIGRSATLLAAPASANGVPVGAAGLDMATTFGANRCRRFAITPRLDHSGGVKAELDLDTVSADLDTIVRAAAPGSEGNAITVAAVGDNDALTAATTVLTAAANFARANAFSTLTVSVNPTNAKASLALDPLTANVDTVVEEQAAGSAGNSTTLAFVADGTGAGTLDESAYPAIVFHFETAVTTVEDFEDAVAASTHLDVKTAGTGANVLAVTVDEIAATALAGGTSEAFEVGGRTYPWVAVLSGAANEVLIGATIADSLDNAAAAITGGAGAGSTYGTGTVAHATVTAVRSGSTLVATAKSPGTGGNALTTSETMANASWTSTVLAGGAAPGQVVLGAKTYRGVNYLAAANDILIGPSASASLDNLIAAVNAAGGEGTTYGTGTTANAQVGAAAGDGDTVNVTADTAGTAGNAIASTTTVVGWSFTGATLAGGLASEGVTIEEDVGALTVVIHYAAGESTVANVETAIAADSTLIEVKTAGTGATVLGENDEFEATALAGGSDASVSGIFTLWGRATATSVWSVIERLNAGVAVAGSEPHAQTFLVEVGLYARLYLQAASLTGTASATVAEILEPGD